MKGRWGKVPLETLDSLVVVDGEAQSQNALALSTAHGQQSVTATALQRFFPLEVVAELLCFVTILFVLYHLRLDEGLTAEGGTNLIARALVFANLLGNNILGTLQGCMDVGG